MAGENDFDNYLDSVADLTSENSDGTTTDTDVGQDTTTPQQTTEQSGVDTTKSDTTQDSERDQQSQPDAKSQNHKRRPSRDADGNLLDARGNIVDENGEIIAPAGKARRIYQQNERLTRQLTDTTQRLQQLELQVQEQQYLNGIPRQYGLSTDEVATALDLAGRMKRGDALGVAKEIIAQLAAMGHNVSELLGESVGDSIDMRAVTTLLDRRLAPITQREEQERARQEAEVRGRQAYQQFLDTHENADIHQDAIARYMQQMNVTPEQAYYALYKFAIDNQLDFSIPLGPQIEERRSQQTQQTQQQQQQQPRHQRPLPSNESATRNSGVTEPAPVYADPDEDWGSIIRRAMQ